MRESKCFGKAGGARSSRFLHSAAKTAEFQACPLRRSELHQFIRNQLSHCLFSALRANTGKCTEHRRPVLESGFDSWCGLVQRGMSKVGSGRSDA